MICYSVIRLIAFSLKNWFYQEFCNLRRLGGKYRYKKRRLFCLSLNESWQSTRAVRSPEFENLVRILYVKRKSDEPSENAIRHCILCASVE